MSALVLHDRLGRITLGSRIGEGGEGAVYEVSGRPGVVAKVYKTPTTREKADKLLAMPAMSTAQLTAIAAWPSDLLRTPDGAVRGLLMPRVDGFKDIHLLYGPKSRLVHFPNADWRHLVHAALNTARAFHVVHAAGCVIGDVNHGGILVSQQATVRLIDCDSFQFKAGGRQYLCDVGVQDFTPPELQGRPFNGIVRTANHDNFGLAVIVFSLLMMGRHPFIGRYSGRDEMTTERAIREFRYAYGQGALAVQMQPPLHVPMVATASAPVAGLWERAFGRNGTQPSARPSAQEWVGVLDALEKQLARCGVNPGHYFVRGSGPCPWCPLEAAAGIMLFAIPLVGMPAAEGGAFHLDAVWARIAAVPSLAAATEPAMPQVQPITEAVRLGELRKKRFYIGHSTYAILIVAIFAFNASLVPLALLFGVFGFALTTAWVNRSGNKDVFEKNQQVAKVEYEDLQRRWGRSTDIGPFVAKLSELQGLRQEWQGLPALRQSRYQQLIRLREAHERKRFLDRHLIQDASIDGIGPGRKATLRSFGVESAGDVHRGAFDSIPGFGPKLIGRILAWRRAVENRFTFNVHAGVDARDVAQLDREINLRKSEIERRLSAGPNELTQVRSALDTQRRQYITALERAAYRLAQAQADLAAIG